MNKHLLKRVLPILLALALLIAAAPHAAMGAEAAPTPAAEPEMNEAKAAVSKTDLPAMPDGDGGDVDFDEVEAVDLKPGVEAELAFSEGEEYLYLRFTPPHAGIYSLASYGNLDVYVNLWTASGEWISGDDDGGENLNFFLRAFFAADQTYYFRLGNLESEETYTNPFTVLLTEEEGGLSGFCGADEDNLVWSFDPETGVLTIEGRGAMDDFFEWNGAPWNPLRNYIQAVELPEGLTYYNIPSIPYESDTQLQAAVEYLKGPDR